MIKIKPVILFIGNNYADVVSITAVGSGIVNGKLITKTVKKNTIKNLHSSSKIHVYAIVKLK